MKIKAAFFYKPSTAILLLAVALFGCNKKPVIGPSDGLFEAKNNITFEANLSTYGIYNGEYADLTPSEGYYKYELGSSLFSDKAQKQRLIFVPEGTQLTMVNDGLPQFPDGTIIVKTFYYFLDERDESLGKQILETRLLIKEAGLWNVGEYQWNEAQTDAQLITSGAEKLVSYTDNEGATKVVSYHLPNERECATCHYNNEVILPIGPKIRNLNVYYKVGGFEFSQINDMQNIGLMSAFDFTNATSTPDYHDASLSNKERTRGYLDINCAHCHFDGGLAVDTELYLTYEATADSSGLKEESNDIISRMQRGNMPSIGTFLIDEDNLSFIEAYLNQL